MRASTCGRPRAESAALRVTIERHGIEVVQSAVVGMSALQGPLPPRLSRLNAPTLGSAENRDDRPNAPRTARSGIHAGPVELSDDSPRSQSCPPQPHHVTQDPLLLRLGRELAILVGRVTEWHMTRAKSLPASFCEGVPGTLGDEVPEELVKGTLHVRREHTRRGTEIDVLGNGMELPAAPDEPLPQPGSVLNVSAKAILTDYDEARRPSRNEGLQRHGEPRTAPGINATRQACILEDVEQLEPSPPAVPLDLSPLRRQRVATVSLLLAADPRVPYDLLAHRALYLRPEL